jgi:NADH-quinone oxidoreductase subunit N
MDLNQLLSDLIVILPLAALVVWACLLLLIDAWTPPERKGMTAALAFLGMSLALGLTVLQAGQVRSAFAGMITADGFAAFMNVIFLGSGLIGVLLAYNYLRERGIHRGEYYILMLFSISGMMLMAYAADLIVVFLALELLSIPLYVLAGFARPEPYSEEASMKYFLLGAFSSSFVVYGIALIFGATGTTSLVQIVPLVANPDTSRLLLLVGAGLTLIGLAFKVAVAPFHMWTPDVYQGAPTAATAFMSVAAKAAGFAGLFRVFSMAFPGLAEELVPIFWGLAALTMIVGNVIAIAQSNLKRLLAYSSIAHAGYIFTALVPLGREGVAETAVSAALFYLLAYGLTSFAAWAVVIALEEAEGRGLELNDYAGLGRKYPMLAFAMAVAMFSFTGIPPTLGFFGKFYLFRALVEGGYIGLAIIGVLTSLVSAYYYLRVVIVMYMQEGEPVVGRDRLVNLTAGLSALAVVALTLVATPLFTWATQAVMRLL